MVCNFILSALSNSVGTLLVDWVAKPVKAQFHYVRHYRENVGKFQEQKEQVRMARERLEHEMQECQRQLLEIEADVLALITDAGKALQDMSILEMEIQRDKKCFNRCPNWWWRYRLSKKLEKKTLPFVSGLMDKLDKHGNPKRVGYRGAIIPTVQFMSLAENFHVSKASDKAFKEIFDALLDDNVSMIGLWGMGGVGKTTLVHEVGNQALNSKKFNRVVIVTVSGSPNFETIQDEIAKELGFSMKNDQGDRRATQELWSKLQTEKSILIILDDVWAEIDLKRKVGIPVGKDSKACKVILTTRRYHICETMKCQPKIELGCLDEHEASELFKKKAELQNCNDEDIKKVADRVIKKCQGLPIALITLGSALQGQSLYCWETTYEKLENHRLGDIEGIENTTEKNVYLCLETSFDFLKDIETKMCFLFCSLFPEDYEIDVEDLVRYAWGLEFYKNVTTITQVRYGVFTVIETLKKSCLLLNAKEGHVKMHDMVRDVALWISSKNHDIFFKIKSKVIQKTWPREDFKSCTALSLMITDKKVTLPDDLVCPDLKFLLVGGRGYRYEILLGERKGQPASIPIKFFEGMQTLKVCSLYHSDIRMIAFDRFTTDLRSLHLKWCRLSTISVLGKLTKLEILSISECHIIELPNEIGDLNNLKMLDLSKCGSLKRIPAYLISKLSNLEELYLDGCRQIRWAKNQKTAEEENYASLYELSSLSDSIKGLSLEVYFEDRVPKDFVFPKLEKFHICIYVGVFDSPPPRFEDNSYKKGIVSRSLCIDGSALHACKQLFRDLDSLKLLMLKDYQNLVPSFGVAFKSITCLELGWCKDMKYLIDATKQEMITTTAFSNLVRLVLRGMGQLEELCNGPQPLGFLQNLKVVKIFGCNNLTYIFSASVAKSLGSLEKLLISECAKLEEIIQETEASNISLQRLQKVRVESCHKLKSLSSLCHGRILENLKKLIIRSCDELEYTFPTSMAECLPQLNSLDFRRLPNLKRTETLFTLPSLRELRMECHQEWFPVTVSAKIEVLRIHMIGCDPRDLSTHRTATELTNKEHTIIMRLEGHLFDSTYNPSMLRDLTLRRLFHLQVIWKDVIQVENFQSLAGLEIDRCKSLKHVFSDTIAQNLPQLRHLVIRECDELVQIIVKNDHLQSLILNLPQLRSLILSRLPELVSFVPIGYGLEVVLPSLTKLYVEKCPNIATSFGVDSNNCGHIHNHTKTEPSSSSSVDNNIAQEFATTSQQTTYWPIGSDIHWERD